MEDSKKYFYFDYAATTPLDPRVLKLMMPFLTSDFGNSANLYSMGRSAQTAIADAQKKIAAALHSRPGEFIFTGSATEADNLALQGTYRANHEAGNKMIVSAIEHKGIREVCQALAKEGCEIVELPVDKHGRVSPEDLASRLDKKTILVSVAYTDSETGTIQPIAELSGIIKNFRRKNNSHAEPHTLDPIGYPYFHTDASQAAAHLDLDVQKLGVDLATLSAHKIYGPKGMGGLFVRKGVKLAPIIYGGGQQLYRSGTENVAGIVGFGEAMALTEKERKAESARLKKLRDALEKGIFKKITKVVLNGHPTRRLPNFLNISILDIEGESLLLYLDEKGIFVNTGSACNSQSLEPSYVLRALGRPYEYVHGSIRFTLGKQSTRADVAHVLKELPPLVEKLRRISPVNLDPSEQKEMSLPKAFVGGQTPHFLRKKNK